MRFKLVASDIDGTLLREDGTISPRTVDVLAALPVPFVLVTGRPVRWLHQLYDQMPAPVPAVCANGAVIYDPADDRVLLANPLSTELLLDVSKKLREAVPDIALAVEVEDGRAFWYEEAWPVRWEGQRPHQVRVLTTPEELTSVPAVKLLARSAAHEADAFYELISQTLGDVAETTHSSKSALVEISAPAVTKAAGLAWLCERDGLSAADVLAFGDMPNDIPMLAWAGTSYAMADAHETVRAAAGHVAPGNDDDGVARVLEQLLGLG